MLSACTVSIGEVKISNDASNSQTTVSDAGLDGGSTSDTGPSDASHEVTPGSYCASLSPRATRCSDFDFGGVAFGNLQQPGWVDPFFLSSDRPLSAPLTARFTVAMYGTQVNTFSAFNGMPHSRMRIRLAARRSTVEDVPILWVGYDKDTSFYVSLVHFDGVPTVTTRLDYGAPGTPTSNGTRLPTGYVAPVGEWIGIDFTIDLGKATYLLATGKPGEQTWTSTAGGVIPTDAGRIGGLVEVGIKRANGPVIVDIDNLAIDFL